MSAESKSGTYFKEIYADLVERAREFPASDPSPNLQECIGIPKRDYVNFLRAEMLARQHNLSSDIITHLREMAILQYLIDYKNPEGLQRLREEFELTQDEAARIIMLILQEKKYPCSGFTIPTEMAINDNWADVCLKTYAPIVEKAFEGSWIKKLFGLK